MTTYKSGNVTGKDGMTYLGTYLKKVTGTDGMIYVGTYLEMLLQLMGRYT